MILEFLLISLAIQVALFIPAYLFKTDKLTDLSYSLTFVLLAGISLLRSDITTLKLVLFFMVLAWGLRLGIYLFIRINKIKKDSRFDEIRIDPIKFLSFWVFQGITVFVVLLPTLLFFQVSSNYSLLTLAGFVIWLIGLVTEGFADQQKFAFKNDSKNKDKWVDVGLWKYSRHPNYLGEILCWVGIYLFTFNSLSINYKLLGLVSPLFIITILLFVSGIPRLEEKADKKWGGDKEYQKYKRNTAVLIPFVY